ncbi:unnamed protein product [Alopecurus aequalis]
MSLTTSSSVATILVLLLALQLGARAAAAEAPDDDSCITTCGNASVPYPFGITGSGAGCYWPGFNLTCADDTKLLLGDGMLEVAEIYINNGTVRVLHAGDIPIDKDGYGRAFAGGLRDHGPYTLSHGNELVVVGCNVYATLLEKNNDNIIGGCASFCPKDDPDQAGRSLCDGVGCCRTPIVQTRDDVAGNVVFRWLGPTDGAGRDDAPRCVFVAEEGWFDRDAAANLTSAQDAVVPVLLHWAVAVEGDRGAPNCTSEAARRRVCRSNHSTCATRGRGYTCSCQPGYQGNPYITGAGGCTDINECEPSAGQGKCTGECTNTEGGFICRCPKGSSGNPDDPQGCLEVKDAASTAFAVGIGVGSGVGIILLILIVFSVMRRLKLQRASKLKYKFFEQNRGQLLKQLVSQRADIAERMIITLEELEKATNNFDKSRELGDGGHGTVYKGILSDLHVVAIKKPKLVVQKEIDEFINEVAILSQVNHKNVVKLYGCCLETEVPMLVYEFISNGTLYDHLHVGSLSWNDRLRIAIETAKSLAYLHCAVKIPIIHRDIKSVNILLDDTLTAKVADFGASRYIPMDKSGVTTMVQGTLGYLDPMYFYTSRLTDKSDVYSFGVILVELLTRRKPFLYMTSRDDSLVASFVTMLAEGMLSQILDPRVIKEGGKEVEGVAKLAVACVQFKGEDRPTMRQVELRLEGLQTSMDHVLVSPVVEIFDMDDPAMNFPSINDERHNDDSISRKTSLEEEFMLSREYPR